MHRTPNQLTVVSELILVQCRSSHSITIDHSEWTISELYSRSRCRIGGEITRNNSAKQFGKACVESLENPKISEAARVRGAHQKKVLRARSGRKLQKDKK